MKFYCVTIKMKATIAVLSCGAVYYAVQGGSNFVFVDENTEV